MKFRRYLTPANTGFVLLCLSACGGNGQVGNESPTVVIPQSDSTQTAPSDSSIDTSSSTTPSLTTTTLEDTPRTLQPTHSYLCLALNGNKLIQTGCTDSNQKFEFRDAGNGVMRWHQPSTDRCLYINNNSLQLGETLVAGTCESNDTEYWRVSEVRGGLQLTNDYSGLCAGISDRSSSPNAGLNQWPCNGQENQVFLFGANESPPPSAESDINISNNPNRRGKWSNVKTMPLVPVAAANLSNGKVLMWSAYKRDNYAGGEKNTITAVYDPITEEVISRNIQNTAHDMFCPGIANLPDGRILVSGGNSNQKTSIYNPETDKWETAAKMQTGRGYHSSLTLSDGAILTAGGSWSGPISEKGAEIYRNDRWQKLNGINTGPMSTDDSRGQYRADNHMWLFAWQNGSVFQAGPSKTMHWLDTNGNGSYRTAGTRGSDNHAMNGNAVMYDVGRILTVGGAKDYDNSEATANAHVIDITRGSAATRKVQSTKRRRAFHNSVVLPSGEVIVIGGQTYATPFSDQRSVLIPELFDPLSETWSDLPSMRTPRNYHSVALLLADGRVLSGGGGLCGDCETNHDNIEILTPPYLLGSNNALKQRPVIEESPRYIGYTNTFTVKARGNVDQFVLMRAANSTHSVNNAQRRVPLPTTSAGNDEYIIEAPATGGIAPPGLYMLFAVDSDGTPSIAKYISIN